MSSILTSNVEDENICHTELELTSWWKWGKPPEHKIKNLWIITIRNFAGNNFAISSEGVTQALSRGGSVLANYGVTLADSVAMISSANESIQNPERIGNGLKSIAINLGGLKTNAKTGAMELNKTALALKDIAGIDVFTDKSQTSVKGMVQLMEEIKGKWGELTQAQQLALSEALAGKTQAQVFQSLMKNWNRVREFQEAYNKGWTIGSAQREKQHSPYVQKCA